MSTNEVGRTPDTSENTGVPQSTGRNTFHPTRTHRTDTSPPPGVIHGGDNVARAVGGLDWRSNAGASGSSSGDVPALTDPLYLEEYQRYGVAWQGQGGSSSRDVSTSADTGRETKLLELKEKERQITQWYKEYAKDAHNVGAAHALLEKFPQEARDDLNLESDYRTADSALFHSLEQFKTGNYHTYGEMIKRYNSEVETFTNNFGHDSSLMKFPYHIDHMNAGYTNAYHEEVMGVPREGYPRHPFFSEDPEDSSQIRTNSYNPSGGFSAT